MNSIKHTVKGPYERFVKRFLDFILSFLALLILSPLFLLVVLLVRLKLGSPIIFSQDRPGRNEKTFTLYKFRSMTDKRDENGNLLPDAERLTKFGKLLRSTSLDELPELFNILKGDMSIVGPRPLLMKYLPYYYENERERHAVRPGLTGLAQTHGRNYLLWEERLAMDVRYVQNITFVNDLKIVLDTVIKVIKRADVAEKRIPTLEEVRRDKNAL